MPPVNKSAQPSVSFGFRDVPAEEKPQLVGEVFSSVAERYERAGKRLHLTHLSAECRQLLARAGDLVEVNLSEDPQYHVATDRID